MWCRGQTLRVNHPLAHTGSRWSTCSGAVGGSRAMRHFLWSLIVTTRGGRGITTALDRRRLPCVTTQGSGSGFGYLTFFHFLLCCSDRRRKRRGVFPPLLSGVRRRVLGCLWTALKTPEPYQWRACWPKWLGAVKCEIVLLRLSFLHATLLSREHGG